MFCSCLYSAAKISFSILFKLQPNHHVDILVTESIGAFYSLFAALRFKYILTFFGIFFPKQYVGHKLLIRCPPADIAVATQRGM